MEKIINTKDLYVGQIKNKSHIPGIEYIITSRYIFKKFKYKNEIIYQEILDNEIYIEDDDTKIINLIPFNVLFPNVINPTRETIKNLLYDLKSEDIIRENNKKRKLTI